MHLTDVLVLACFDRWDLALLPVSDMYAQNDIPEKNDFDRRHTLLLVLNYFGDFFLLYTYIQKLRFILEVS